MYNNPFAPDESDYDLLGLYDPETQTFNTSKRYDALMEERSRSRDKLDPSWSLKMYSKRRMKKKYDSIIGRLRDRGFADEDIFNYLSEVQSNPDKYIGGSEYLPSHLTSRRSKRYTVEGDMDIYMDKLLVYADEASRLYSREQEELQAAMSEEKSMRKQQEFDYKAEQVSDFERDMKRYDMSESERAQQASEQYIDSKSRQYTAKGQPKNPYGVMIMPQDRPV
jgi:hypothetical protein